MEELKARYGVQPSEPDETARQAQFVELARVVFGVGKDAPTTVNEAGGKQSDSPYRCDLLPAHAVLAVAAVLKHGADKYGENNWRKITVADNLNHAMTHIFAYLAGDEQDDHLEHAACRILFALDLKREGVAK